MSKKYYQFAKSHDYFIYKWSPQEPEYKKDICSKNNTRKRFCTATPFSQGEDWVVTYVYNIEMIKASPKRIAYVECDYVR
jgi:hypothetical protein